MCDILNANVPCCVFDRCTEEYEVSIFQPRFKPNNLEYHGDKELVRYGYISSTNGDMLSYAKQASEGSFIILDKNTFIKTIHIYAQVPKDTNYNAIIFGLTKEEDSKLLLWTTLARKQWSRKLLMHFELKHSFFQRLHAALDKLNPEIINKIMPSRDIFSDESRRPWIPGKPKYEALELDSYQQRALGTIMSCSPGAPVLVTGPFGTGKTRLLARAAYEILRSPKSRVLICAHHQASVDTFVEILGNIINNELVRIIPNKSYHSQTRKKYPHLFARNSQSQRLVITTLGILRTHSKFSHILIDEGAQAREPDIIGPLRFAHRWTKIIIAGDHLQVKLLPIQEYVHLFYFETCRLDHSFLF